jgi:ATP synthase I chain
MQDFTNSAGGGAFSAEAEGGMNTRILRTMAVAVGLAIVVSAVLAPWRVTAGLLLGGGLSLLNYSWMKGSISAAFSLASPGVRPQIRLAKYILRYLIVGLSVYAAYRLNLVSLPATFGGLCSFVVALFVEAFREFYLTIVHREEIG